MALKKKLQFNNIEASYWRVVGINISFTGKMTQIFLVGYKDEADRLENKNIISKNYMMQSDVFSNYVSIEQGILIGDIYKFLRENIEDFANAEDI